VGFWEMGRISGLGCDAKKVIAILGHRTLAQRRAIADAYFQTFGEDLHKRLRSELHGNFEVCTMLRALSFNLQE